MTSTRALLNDIEQFLSKTPMGETTFGVMACGNSKLVPRLRAGNSCSLDTADKVHAFIKSHNNNLPSSAPPPADAHPISAAE